MLSIFSIWYSIRNDAVFSFRNKILDAVYKLSLDSIDDENDYDYYYIYRNMVGYDKMMFSFKPLKPNYWMSEEDYLKIKDYLI